MRQNQSTRSYCVTHKLSPMLQLSPTEEFVRGKWVESWNMKTRRPRPGCGVGVASFLTWICALRGQKVAKIQRGR